MKSYTRTLEQREMQSLVMIKRFADPVWRARHQAARARALKSRQLTPRQIRYVGLLAQGVVPYRAYREAGYSPDRCTCYRLLEDPRIGKAVKAIRRRAMRRSEIDIDKLLSWSNEVREKAVETKQLSAAQGTIALMAKLCGLLTDKTQVTMPIESMDKNQIIEGIKKSFENEPEKALLMLSMLGLDEKIQTNKAPESLN